MKKSRKILAISSMLLFLIAVRPGYRMNRTFAQKQTQEDRLSSGYVPGRLLVKFHGASAAETGNLITGMGVRRTGEIEQIGLHILELPAGADEEAFAHAFRERPEVAFAELDVIRPPADIIPNDPSYTNEWHLPRIAGPTAWPISTGSSSVTIAICDTGVEGTHPDLASKMVAGWNFYDNNSNTADVYGHGTAVAGTAAAASNNGVGVASVAWNCLIMPLRVSDASGNATSSAIASAITWAADHGARVANVSYIVSDSATVSSSAQYFQSKGGVVVCSAGNYATFDSSPDNPYMLVVSATDQNDVLTSWSNTGNNVDLSAPGVNIGTTTMGGTYGFGSGTSFSAPIVAGVAALVISANASLTPAQVTGILEQSADDLGPPGWDSGYGWGRVNAGRALNLAVGTAPLAPDTTPPTVSFSSPAAGAGISGTVAVQVAASDNVAVTMVSLSVDGGVATTDSAAPYSFSWNTTGFANGSHTLTATASDAAGNTSSAQITVTVNNSAPDATPPAISITSPVNGAKVNGVVSVQVNATDNVAVAKVELYVDGVLKSASTAAPFSMNWNSRKATSGAHTLQCKAYDAAGNVGASANETVYK